MAAARATANDLAIVDLRELRGGDLTPILDEQTSHWRSNFHWDFSGSRQAIRRFLDNRSLHGFALVSAGRPVGYSYFVNESGKALVGDLYVLAKYRNAAAERPLLIRTLEAAATYPGIRRVEGQLLALSFELEPETIFRRPLKTFPRYFMLREDLGRAPLPEPSPGGPHIFRPWSEQFAEGAARLISESYAGHVDGRINDQYRTLAGARRFLANTTRQLGCGLFLAAASGLAFRPSALEPDGLCLASRVDGDSSHITQICVAPRARRRGLGRALLLRTMGALERRGCDSVSLTVTASNAEAVRLYETLAFWRVRRFSAFVWETN